jgi:hypothetical protein
VFVPLDVPLTVALAATVSVALVGSPPEIVNPDVRTVKMRPLVFATPSFNR